MLALQVCACVCECAPGCMTELPQCALVCVSVHVCELPGDSGEMGVCGFTFRLTGASCVSLVWCISTGEAALI